MSVKLAPATTLTAEIVIPGYGNPYLHVVIDGQPVTVRIDEHLRRLHAQTVTDEAARLLRRHAGYEPASEWTQDANGRLTATVAEITGRCTICVHGCGCSATAANCGHYQCVGRVTDPTIVHSCDGAALALTALRPSLKSVAGRSYAQRKRNPRLRNAA